MNALNADIFRVRSETDKMLDKVLAFTTKDYERIIDAMRYATIGGGKAFRPLLVTLVAELYELKRSVVAKIGTAIEMVHSYSLIHDDLPCMDNDIMRRGKAATHIRYGEATAVLAGDALLTQAFILLSEHETGFSSMHRIKLIHLLAEAAGANGMIGGQMMDILGEKTPLTFEQIETMQRLKTGALIRFSCIAPAIAADAEQHEIDALTKYADALGRLFQLTDDLLDEEADVALLGKSVGKDRQAGKSTFIGKLGIEKTRHLASQCAHEAQQALAPFGNRSHKLFDLVNIVLNRKQ